MLHYDARDASFLVTDKIIAVFDIMGRHEEKWVMKCSSQL